MRSKFTVFLNEAPDITIDENDTVHIVDAGNEVSVDRVMSIHSLRVYVERGQRLLADYESRQASERDTRPKV